MRMWNAIIFSLRRAKLGKLLGSVDRQIFILAPLFAPLGSAQRCAEKKGQNKNICYTITFLLLSLSLAFLPKHIVDTARNGCRWCKGKGNIGFISPWVSSLLNPRRDQTVTPITRSVSPSNVHARSPGKIQQLLINRPAHTLSLLMREIFAVRESSDKCEPSRSLRTGSRGINQPSDHRNYGTSSRESSITEHQWNFHRG